MLTPNPKLYGADQLECDMYAAGYRRSPNNIHSLPSAHWYNDDPLKGESPVWYSGHEGLWEPLGEYEIQVCHDRIRVFASKFFGEPHTRCSFWDQITIAVFISVPDFVEWCKVNGRLSLPGLPAGIHGD